MLSRCLIPSNWVPIVLQFAHGFQSFSKRFSNFKHDQKVATRRPSEKHLAAGRFHTGETDADAWLVAQEWVHIFLATAAGIAIDWSVMVQFMLNPSCQVAVNKRSVTDIYIYVIITILSVRACTGGCSLIMNVGFLNLFFWYWVCRLDVAMVSVESSFRQITQSLTAFNYWFLIWTLNLHVANACRTSLSCSGTIRKRSQTQMQLRTG